MEFSAFHFLPITSSFTGYHRAGSGSVIFTSYPCLSVNSLDSPEPSLLQIKQAQLSRLSSHDRYSNLLTISVAF